MKWYKQYDVNVVPKTANPPNYPELRIIEKDWGIIKRKMKKIKRFCRNFKDLEISCKKASNSYDCRAVRMLMGTTKPKVRKFIRCPQEQINFFEIFYLHILMY